MAPCIAADHLGAGGNVAGGSAFAPRADRTPLTTTAGRYQDVDATTSSMGGMAANRSATVCDPVQPANGNAMNKSGKMQPARAMQRHVAAQVCRRRRVTATMRSK